MLKIRFDVTVDIASVFCDCRVSGGTLISLASRTRGEHAEHICVERNTFASNGRFFIAALVETVRTSTSLRIYWAFKE